VTKIKYLLFIYLVTPKTRAKHEPPLFNEPASETCSGQTLQLIFSISDEETKKFDNLNCRPSLPCLRNSAFTNSSTSRPGKRVRKGEEKRGIHRHRSKYRRCCSRRRSSSGQFSDKFFPPKFWKRCKIFSTNFWMALLTFRNEIQLERHPVRQPASPPPTWKKLFNKTKKKCKISNEKISWKKVFLKPGTFLTVHAQQLKLY
jgi:hypothetical protein